MYVDKKIKLSLQDRIEINKKILYIVNGADPQELTKQDLFAYWSEKGQLHDIKRSQFSSMHNFSEAKKKVEQGQFFTPVKVCKDIVEALQVTEKEFVADLTCGKGSFFAALPSQYNCYGCEIDEDTARVAKYLFPNANIEIGSIKHYSPNVKFNIIVGNPPFNIMIDGVLSQVLYFMKAASLMVGGGLMGVVVPDTFLNDAVWDGKKRKLINELFNFIAQYRLPASSFSANIATKVMFFQRKGEGLIDSVIKRPYVSREQAVELVKKARKNTHLIMSKLASRGKDPHSNSYSMSRQGYNWVDGFEFTKAKYMYELKRQPELKEKLKMANAYLLRFSNQVMPSFKNTEAQKEFIKKHWITKRKVIAYLKKLVKVKKTKKNPPSALSIKKRRRYNRNYLMAETPIDDMAVNKGIGGFLDRFELYDKYTKETIKLNSAQKKDINIVIQKPEIYLQWKQGSGKSIAALAKIDYELQHFKWVRNIFIVGPAIAIRNTWNDILDAYDKDYIFITKISDIAKIRRGQIVTITVNTLIKIQKHIKKYVKINGGKILAVLDEADIITNLTSKRTKAVLNCFQMSKHKLLLSGTMTRNNIAEAFSQFYFMHGGTQSFVVDTNIMYERDAKTGKIKGKFADYFELPFPAYRKGNKAFKQLYNPGKTTVFGMEKHNQRIFNKKSLKKLISKCVITRSFEDIVGSKIYEIEQIQCKMSQPERDLTAVIRRELQGMLRRYFLSTGNSRKDSMFRALQQLLLEIKACAVPTAFDEYTGGEPAKFSEVRELVRKTDGHVAIGVTHIATLNAYAQMITEVFPRRKLFVVSGQNSSIVERKKIIESMRDYEDSILLSTQQSLSSSMNIEFVDTIIIPELDWNDSKMSQYYFRFIRFNSTRRKKVIFVTYARSIESNLLSLIMNKEKLNLFMKNEDVEDSRIYEIFGVKAGMMMNLLMKDEDGNIVEDWHSNVVL